VSASSEGDRLLYELGMLIARSRRLVWTAAARELEDNGFSSLSWVLVTYLVHQGPATQREIATAIGQHPAGVSRLVDELETKGLVRRRRDATDRRRARVELTARGRKLAEAGRPHVIGALREALSPLSKSELTRLYRLLHKLVPAPLPIGGRRGDDQVISRNSRSGSSK
jgi:DNA-binding MarR family transcriptional regulator